MKSKTKQSKQDDLEPSLEQAWSAATTSVHRLFSVVCEGVALSAAKDLAKVHALLQKQAKRAHKYFKQNSVQPK